MSDHPPDSPNLARSWCPECEPDGDPTREILETRYCGLHAPPRDGVDDARAGYGTVSLGMGDADPEACRAIQSIINGGT